MAAPTDFARQLLVAARRDLTVWRKLAGDAEVHDAVLGFHAQQAIEKCLKAVLARAGVVFRRTHDIAELLDAIEDAALPAPPHADRLDELNPYAVEARYGWAGSGALERGAVSSWLAAVEAWACAQVGDGGTA